MTKKVLKMRVVRCGVSAKVIVSNSFPRKVDPETGKLMDVYVCVGGALLREDGYLLDQEGNSIGLPEVEPEVVTVKIGDRLDFVPERNNLPDNFEWQYPNGGFFSG